MFIKKIFHSLLFACFIVTQIVTSSFSLLFAFVRGKKLYDGNIEFDYSKYAFLASKCSLFVFMNSITITPGTIAFNIDESRKVISINYLVSCKSEDNVFDCVNKSIQQVAEKLRFVFG